MARTKTPGEAGREGFQNGSAAFAFATVAAALGVTALSGPLEEEPRFPMSAEQAKELAALHVAAPQASREDRLSKLKDERDELFRRLRLTCSTEGGLAVAPKDESRWTQSDYPTGNPAQPFVRNTTILTGFSCDGREWALKGEGAELHFVTPRGIGAFSEWSTPVTPMSSGVATIGAEPEKAQE